MDEVYTRSLIMPATLLKWLGLLIDTGTSIMSVKFRIN